MNEGTFQDILARLQRSWDWEKELEDRLDRTVGELRRERAIQRELHSALWHQKPAPVQEKTIKRERPSKNKKRVQ